MDRLEDPIEVWDNGIELPCRPLTEETAAWMEDLSVLAGAHRRIATRWRFRNEFYESRHCPRPIPDRSGLVYAIEGWKAWVVLRPDASTKFVITVPRLSHESMPDHGDLGHPREMQDGPPHVMFGDGSDGHRRYRFYFDMRNGRLIDLRFDGY